MRIRILYIVNDGYLFSTRTFGLPSEQLIESTRCLFGGRNSNMYLGKCLGHDRCRYNKKRDNLTYEHKGPIQHE